MVDLSDDVSKRRLMDSDAALDELLALLERTTTLADMHFPPKS